jgi:hypothetical protein
VSFDDARRDFEAWRAGFPEDPFVADAPLRRLLEMALPAARSSALARDASDFGKVVVDTVGPACARYEHRAHLPELARYDSVGRRIEAVYSTRPAPGRRSRRERLPNGGRGCTQHEPLDDGDRTLVELDDARGELVRSMTDANLGARYFRGVLDRVVAIARIAAMLEGREPVAAEHFLNARVVGVRPQDDSRYAARVDELASAD